MSTSAVTATDTTSNTSTTSSTSITDKDMFLKLLVTQLSYQDPLNPIENQDFAAQMAQFSSLEQMQQMNENLTNLFIGQSLGQASALIGKYITAVDSTSGDTITGVASEVAMKDQVPCLKIGTQYVSLYDVTNITDASASTGETSG